MLNIKSNCWRDCLTGNAEYNDRITEKEKDASPVFGPAANSRDHEVSNGSSPSRYSAAESFTSV